MILKEPGDLQIVDGDLALTKDLDLMMGDKSYNALFRLTEHWRHNSVHLAFLMSLLDLMVARHREAMDRLEEASEKDARRKHQTGQFFFRSQEFMDAWHDHFDEEGTAISGQIAYAGCVVMLASNALSRFKDDLDCPDTHWKQCSRQYGGHSVGKILIASANGFRHADEWAKTQPKTERQLKSATYCYPHSAPQTSPSTNPRLPVGVRRSSSFSPMAADSRASPKSSSALPTR